MKLAIKGGKPIRTKPFPFYNPINQKEINAAARVLKTGILSKFLGAWHEHFYGGTEVQSLEKEWAKYFKVKHAISVNSATSGLICAVGAAGISPGDEVIVSPYSMCISATAPLFYSAIPIFADIEENYFCLDPKSVQKKITSRTKAIIVVDIFGQPYDAEKINALAKKHNLTVIEDCAQAPGAMYKNKYAGTLGDMGVYSLNYHKLIHSGEGGIIATNNDKMAERLRLIRNHAEAVVAGKKSQRDLTNMIGFNFRMTEIEAAIAREQLKKLKTLVTKRAQNIKYLEKKLKHISFIAPAKIRHGATHSYYLHPFKYDEKKAGVLRNVFVDAVKAELPVTHKREKEGVRIHSGYAKPIYLFPIFQKQICFGKNGYPFKSPAYKEKLNYQKGLCPVVERMYEKELFYHDLMHSQMSKKDLDDVIKAFYKVANNLSQL